MSSVPTALPESTPAHDELAARVAEFGPWFHNLDLCGVATAPQHFLGDYPNVKWKKIQAALPRDLAGASVLDVGCNAGFYAIKMKQRGAGRVLAIDVVDQCLHQGRFAAQTLGLDIQFEKLSVYDVDQIPGQFDYVFFLGLFYHLRYPLLALDKIATKVGGKLIFQSMLRGAEAIFDPAADYDFWDNNFFTEPGFPAAYFIERSYAHDPTNWFVPNRAGAEAMLRSAGFVSVAHPEHETWICAPRSVYLEGRSILERELDGTL